VEVDAAKAERGPESELAVDNMVRVSVGPCIESSEVAAELCPSTVTAEERWNDRIIGVASGASCRGGPSERCMRL
jgi:hypothetical protein